VLTVFYQTTAQLCFTLLGLWWLVLQTKYREWIGDSARRRLATSISLYFLLPGSMSLLALLGSDIPLLWRTSFAVACALGAIASLPLRAGARRSDAGARRSGSVAQNATMLVARWVGGVLYLGVFIIAVAPPVARFLDVAPLFLAGIGLTVLVILGVSLAWLFFLEQAPAE
jgi:hypothetical protein